MERTGTHPVSIGGTEAHEAAAETGRPIITEQMVYIDLQDERIQDVLGRITRAIKTSYPDAEFLSYIGTNPLGIYIEVYTPNEEFKGLLDILDDKLGNLHIAAGVNICVVPRRKVMAAAA
jgi:hypothetical protein